MINPQIQFILDIGRFSLLIPLFIGLLNIKITLKHNPYLFAYLILCAIMEIITDISLNTKNINLFFYVNIFCVLECILFFKIIYDSFQLKIDKIILTFYILTTLIFLLDQIFSISQYHSLFRSFSKITLISNILYCLIINRRIEKYNRTAVYSILFYSIVTLPTTAILHLVDNKQVTISLLAIMNVANCIYYLLFAYSIYQMKKAKTIINH